MKEEQEMTEQQKKRQAKVLESANYYIEEDWDIIRANVESNAKLSIANFVPMGAEVKEVPVTEEPVKEPTAPKQEEIEQPIKKLGRHKSTAKEDEEYEKEKEELSMFLIIAFDEHKEVNYEILD
ncbi:hypothetical protein Tco_1209122 [Tanacetum coccineum]